MTFLIIHLWITLNIEYYSYFFGSSILNLGLIQNILLLSIVNKVVQIKVIDYLN